MTLTIKNLVGKVGTKTILRGIDFSIEPGEVHAIMGPNGSGKSSFAKTIAGHPDYEVVSGTVKLGRKNMLIREPHERAREGLFVSFQDPIAVPGIDLGTLLASSKKATNGKNLDLISFHDVLETNAAKVGLEKKMLARGVNEGFSGGEKKKAELLQLVTLNPKYAILDEIDTGLDVDALRKTSKIIKTLSNKGTGIIIITHYKRILEYLQPDVVHVLINGRIVKSGDHTLADRVEKQGYRNKF